MCDRRAIAALGTTLLLGCLLASGLRPGQASAPWDDAPAASPASSPAEQKAFVTQYCGSCHNQRAKAGGLALDRLDLSDVHPDAETWEKVALKLRSHAMPPAGARRPDRAAEEAFVAALETSLDKAAATHLNPGRHPAVHRLNRAEYGNAIRDLLDLDIDAGALVPHDDSGYGFDNIADVLSVSPMLTERYLAAARKISRLAVGDAKMQPVTEIYKVDKYLRQDDRTDDELPFGSRGGILVRPYFPVDGEYVVQVFLLRTYDGQIRGLLEAHELEVRLNGKRIEQVSLGESATADGQARRPRRRKTDAEGLEVRFTAPAGPGTLSVSFVAHAAAPEGMARKPYPLTSYEYAGDQTVMPGISRVELRGPFEVTGRGDTPSRQRIFSTRPASDEPAAEQAAAKTILTALARRAYRRTVTDADLKPLLELYQAGRADGDFDAGIERALRTILCSPEFLFRIERDPADAKPGSVFRISDLELASRLSFFLWSSIPDDELLTVAEQGKLSQPPVLEAQVRRLLADERATRMTTNFGGQWLYLRNVPLASPDPHVFPDFDANLREALQRETQLFLESQVRGNRPVTELLTADYTFVNQRLARHYGIEGIYGNQLRRITLTDDARWGLLGKGSILLVTSYNHRTSPVLRGKWLLENLVGSPPPPPPADVPSLEDAASDHGKLISVREKLEAHRANPACASCHKIMDPLGFALENFDGIGRWRTTDGGAPIDPRGTLVDGTTVDGPRALRQALLERPENFVSTVTRKLLTYAMGRGVEYYDEPAVRQIVHDAAADDYHWQTLILAIAKSTPFQMRKAHEP